MAYVDFYDVEGSLTSVKDLLNVAAHGALVREDAFERKGYDEVHRVYLISLEQRVALDRVTKDTFPTKER